MAQSERITDREDEIADAGNRRIADRHIGQSVGIDLDDRDVGAGVGPDQLGVVNGAVNQRNLDFVGIADNVVIGQDQSAFGIHDDTGARARHFLLTRELVGQAEEPSQVVVAKRIAAADLLHDTYVDDPPARRLRPAVPVRSPVRRARSAAVARRPEARRSAPSVRLRR